MAKSNGKGKTEVPPVDSPVKEAAASPPQVDPFAGVESYVTTMLQCTVRGIFSSLPQVPAPITMLTVAKALGYVLACGLESPDIGAILQVRKQLREKFDEGVHLAKIQAPTMATLDSADIKFTQPRVIHHAR